MCACWQLFSRPHTKSDLAAWNTVAILLLIWHDKIMGKYLTCAQNMTLIASLVYRTRSKQKSNEKEEHLQSAELRQRWHSLTLTYNLLITSYGQLVMLLTPCGRQLNPLISRNLVRTLERLQFDNISLSISVWQSAIKNYYLPVKINTYNRVLYTATIDTTIDGVEFSDVTACTACKCLRKSFKNS